MCVCPRRAGAGGISDTVYVATAETFDLLESYDLVSCVDGLANRTRTFHGPYIDRCFLAWLREQRVHVMAEDFGISIARASGPMQRVPCRRRAAKID